MALQSHVQTLHMMGTHTRTRAHPHSTRAMTARTHTKLFLRMTVSRSQRCWQHLQLGLWRNRHLLLCKDVWTFATSVIGLNAELDVKGCSVTTLEHFSHGSHGVCVLLDLVCDLSWKEFCMQNVVPCRQECDLYYCGLRITFVCD
jgi:hypothetical protein